MYTMAPRPFGLRPGIGKAGTAAAASVKKERSAEVQRAPPLLEIYVCRFAVVFELLPRPVSNLPGNCAASASRPIAKSSSKPLGMKGRFEDGGLQRAGLAIQKDMDRT